MNRRISALALSAALLLPAAAAAQDPAKSAPPPIADLVLKLSAKDPKARLDACTALRTRWPDAARAVPALIEVADDDESADVKKAAVETLGVLGDEGGKSLAAWVKGIGAEERKGIERFVQKYLESGRGTMPAHVWGVYSKEPRGGAPLVMASVADPAREWERDMGHLSPADGIPALDAKEERTRTAAACALAVFARKASIRHGQSPSVGGPWAATAESLLLGDWFPGRWIGLRLAASVVVVGPKVRDPILGTAVVSTGEPMRDAWTALALAGPVTDEIAKELAFNPPIEQCLRYARRLGITREVVRNWAAAQGDEAIGRRWIAKHIDSAEPTIRALLRRAEHDPSRPAYESWAVEVQMLAEGTASSDLVSILAVEVDDLLPAVPGSPDHLDDFVNGPARIRAVAALALLDAQPRHAAATAALRKMLNSEKSAFYAARVVDALPEGAVEIPLDLLSKGYGGSPGTRAIGRRGAASAEMVPKFVRGLEFLRGQAEAESYSPYDPWFYDSICEELRALGKIGPAAASALPEIRQHLTSPDAHIVHIARTAIRRIETK